MSDKLKYRNTQLELFEPETYKRDIESFCDNLEYTIDQRRKTRITKLKTLSIPVEVIETLITYVRAASLVYNQNRKRSA